MKLTTRQTAILLGGIVVALLGFYLVSSNLRSKEVLPAVTLTVWGTDPAPYFDGLFQSYKAARPNVTITYQYIDPEDYEEKVVNALASADGPDVFMVDAHAVPKDQSKLVPVASSTFNIVQLRQLFPTTVEQDFAGTGDIYALPLYSDTLALIYNKDFFDAASIVRPPTTWNEFQDDILKLRQLNENGQVVRAGAAIGGSLRTNPRAADTIYALMLQNGTAMTGAGLTTAAFNSDSGLQAFNFYLRFADAASSYYTWNDALPTAIDSMASGKSAMMIGYKSDFDALKKQSPFLNVDIAALPQPNGGTQAVTYADYQGLAVSKQSRVGAWGWDFVIFATTDKSAQEDYLKVSNRTPMLRSLIGDKLDDVLLSVFAKQALIARSWYQIDSIKTDAIFDKAIRNVLSGSLDAAKALRQAQEQVNLLAR